ncbi:MAG: RNA-binding cell elongation regulator Jag/EloR [Candidatus Izemoplasma sp.]|nr:RNA-binding cell elongation regulator Jag/EloR [Candidatus Izemoplasma sp.]
MKELEFEIKNVDDALDYAAKEMRLDKSYLDVEVINKKGMIIKTYICKATVKVDPAEIAFETLETIFNTMEIDANIEMRVRDNKIEYKIETDENPLLIGKGGKTLERIQYYIRNLINQFYDNHTIVQVDIGGYKANRKKQLEILATKTAKNVARSKVEARLDPMNAYERRIIHTKLADWRDVSTVSKGEGNNRHVVIKPKRR